VTRPNAGAVSAPSRDRLDRLDRLARLAPAREDFLSSGEVRHPDLVGDAIQASWLRSLSLRVDTDHLDPAYVDPPHTEAPLALTAAPVLRHLADELTNEPVGIILTDANGLVLHRLCSDPGLARSLDCAHLGVGFNYAEEYVGTNGIGTALECRAPTLVDGCEHYASGLGTFTCAGVPILHPITGTLLGVLDVTSLTADSNSLLLVVAKSTARRIQQQLLSQASAGELALFTDYLSACKHGGGPVLALGDDLVMMNTQTQRSFDAADRTALLARAADATGTKKPMTLLADLPSGLTARMEYRPAFTSEALAGGVFRVQPGEQPARSAAIRPMALPFPGVSGTSAIWQRTGQIVVESHRRAEWVVLEGEAGVGKLALLQGVHHLRNPSGHFRVIDAADAEDIEAWLDMVDEELAADRGTLVLRRVHLLPPEAVDQLSAMLLEVPAQHTTGDHLWVTMTMGVNPRNPQVDAQLLPHFPRTVEVPPLRHHMDDLRTLVPHLLGRINRENTLTLSTAAMNQLMRLPWPGNVEHLRRVLVRVAQQRRTGVINVDDLPAECRAISRRQLTQMEALERDAIGTSLVTHRGSKDRAAKDLGMSRATIYRKIREYGITWALDQATPSEWQEPAPR